MNGCDMVFLGVHREGQSWDLSQGLEGVNAVPLTPCCSSRVDRRLFSTTIHLP